MNRSIGNVQFRDENKPDREFFLDQKVWIGSILRHSQPLRAIFAESRHINSIYDEQLKVFPPSLIHKVKLWVADMYQGDQAAHDRLLMPMYIEESSSTINTHMSPQYFTTIEARYIGSLVCPHHLCEIGFQQWLIDLHEIHRKNGTDVYTGHNLGPKVAKIFRLKKNF